jgi:hypothetical protein
LSALADGDLPQAEAEALRAHVEGCDACRRELDELTLLKAALADEGRVPLEPRTGWGQLVDRLNQEPRRVWWRPRWSWALAPALLAFAFGGASAWRWHRAHTSDDQLLAEATREFRDADASYGRALDKLRAVTDRARAAWPEDRRREFDAARAALEHATEQCRAVARARPADGQAEDLLFAAYRKQISFYQEQLLR